MAEQIQSQTEEQVSVQDAFKLAMSRLAAGVVMVTCHVDDKPWGLTVSACCSVSMDPPMILVSLGKETTSAKVIEETGVFGISLLGQELLPVAQFGASRGAAKFVHEFCHPAHRTCQSPVVVDAIAHIDCTLDRAVPAGDHTIMLGLVRNVVVTEGDTPLVYYSRSYHKLSEVTDLHVSPVADETVDSLLYDYPVPRRFSRVVSLGD